MDIYKEKRVSMKKKDHWLNYESLVSMKKTNEA